MGVRRQYSVKHYIGLESEKPTNLPPGDFYFATDSQSLYKYGAEEGGSSATSTPVAGEEALTSQQLSTLEHIVYNPIKDQLETDVPVIATLNSFYLGSQHKISSGNQNVFFTNLTDDVVWYPMWGGLKNQHEAGNEGANGVYAPSARVYADQSTISIGRSAGGEYVDFKEVFPVGPDSFSAQGFTLRTGQALTSGTVLYYLVYDYPNTNPEINENLIGTRVYRQDIVLDQDYDIGDIINLKFAHPIEVHAGDAVYDEIRIDDIEGPLLSVAAGEMPYTFEQDVLIRLFEDKRILLEGDVDINTDGLQAEIDLNTSERHAHVNKTVLDNFGEDANQQPTYNGNTVDTIVAQRDVYDGLDSMSTTVSLSAAQGKILKDVQVNQQAEIVLNNAKVGITAEQATDISDNTLAKHEHLNKTIIDNFGEDADQKLTYNGEVVGSGDGSDSQALYYQQEKLKEETLVRYYVNDVVPFPTLLTGGDGLYSVTGKLNSKDLNYAGVYSHLILLYANGNLVSKEIYDVDLVSGISTYNHEFSFTVELPANAVLELKYINTMPLNNMYMMSTPGDTADTYPGHTFIDIKQLPSSITVPTISEESIPVTALENHYISSVEDVDWDNSLSTNTGVIFTLPAVSSDGRYFVDYGLNISPRNSDANISAKTHIRINGNKVPWTTLYRRDYSIDVSILDHKYMNGSSYVNLVAGDVVTLYMESAENVTTNGSTDSDEHVSFIRMNQLPTHTVVPIISEEVIPVNALESHYIPYAVDVDWDGFGDAAGVIFTLPAVLSDGRYLVDYGLDISPITTDDTLHAMTHIRINGNEAPWTTLYTRDYSGDVSAADHKYMNGGSYLNLEAGDVVTLYMESADNVTMNGSTSSDTHVSFIRMNQQPAHTVVPTISEDQLIAQPLLYNRVSWTSEQDVVVPTKTLGELNKLNDDAFITATADGLYDVTVQLSFGNMTIDERLSFALLNSAGELFPNTGQTFVTALSDGTLHTTQLERTTWRVNLVEGEEVYVGISSFDTDVKMDIYCHGTHNGSYIELQQLPTHTVVADVSGLPVTALFEQRTILGSNVNMPVTTAGFVTLVDQIGVVTVQNAGKYLCRVVLPFAGVSDDSWVIRVGVAVMSVGDSVYTPHSEERLQTSLPNFNGVANYDRAINLQAGDKVVVTVVCNAADDWNIASTNNGCYLDVRQLPTHTVVPTISEEAVVVDDQAASGHVDIGTMRMQWGTLNTTSNSTITYPVAFGNVPTLTGSLTEYGSHNTHLTFSSPTETGSTVRLRDLDSTNWETDSFTVSWMAIGLKP